MNLLTEASLLALAKSIYYKLGNRTKTGGVAGMFLLIYVHRKLTSEKENSFFDFIQKGRWAITKSVVG